MEETLISGQDVKKIKIGAESFELIWWWFKNLILLMRQLVYNGNQNIFQ